MLKAAVNSDWPPAQKLKKLVNERKEKIYSNPIIQAGIYLDPRFRTLTLNQNQQANAKKIINSLFMASMNNVEVENQIETLNEDIEMEDELQALLFLHHNLPETSASQPMKNFSEQIRAYEDFKFASLTLGKLNVTEFWMSHVKNLESPINVLAKIAIDIISVPVTEVTAERLFSHLNFIFNKHRASLKGDIVEDILFCRWNKGRF